VGRATAQAFAKAGARIGLIARGRERLEAACREVEELGGRGLVLPADVADADAIEAAAARVEDELGPIDVWVNNATVSVFAPVWETAPADFKRVTEVTYLGYVYGTLAALKRMIPRNRGTVIQVGSALAYRGIPLQSAYCAAKHAIQGFNDSLRAELIHEKLDIHICMVQLSAINTPQFSWTKNLMPRKSQPVPPIFQPEVAADAIVYCASARRREMTVGWPTAKTILFNKVAPGWADRLAASGGWESQMYDGPPARDRPHNLYEPVPGDHGSHGDFDGRAKSFSWHLWMNKNRVWLALAGATLGVLAATALGSNATPDRLGRDVKF
jgi:NAD(P)-dependent dehydrogenase (short-subunit alcohol dehydrogenase family)